MIRGFTSPTAMLISITLGVLSLAAASAAEAAVVVSGSSIDVTGPGSFRFDINATAVGGTETISGFQIPILFSDTVTFGGMNADFTVNPTLSSGFDTVTPLGGDAFGFSAASFTSFLTVADQETVSLGSFIVELTGQPSGQIVVADFAEDRGLLAISDAGGMPVAEVSTGGAFIANVVAVPEPTSTMALLAIGAATLRMRRRNGSRNLQD